MTEKRKKIWIDRFQTLLFVRIACYFLFYQIAVWALVFIERGIYLALKDVLGPAVTTACLLFVFAAVVIIGFLFIYDAIAFVHRIVGPLYRFRQAIKAVTAKEDLELIMLRKKDFLQEMKDDFNEMLKALEQRGAVVLKPQETKPGG